MFYEETSRSKVRVRTYTTCLYFLFSVVGGGLREIIVLAIYQSLVFFVLLLFFFAYSNNSLMASFPISIHDIEHEVLSKENWSKLWNSVGFMIPRNGLPSLR